MNKKLQITLYMITAYLTIFGVLFMFLPRVAADMGWDRDTLLDHLCVEKAGLPPGAWRDPDASLWIFESEEFGDSPA